MKEGIKRYLDHRTGENFEETRRENGLLLWPVELYRVAIPVRKPAPLNLFEETVLRLLSVAPQTESGLVGKLGIPEALLQFILIRLRDLGLTNQSLIVTDPAIKLLKEIDEAKPEYAVGLFFRERVGGWVLPIAHQGQPRYATQEKFGKGLEIPDGDFQPPLPERAFRTAVRQFQLLDRQYHPGGRVKEDGEIILSEQSPFHVQGEPEQAWLCCDLVFPLRREGRWVADPFGYGYSEILTQMFEKESLIKHHAVYQHYLQWEKNARSVDLTRKMMKRQGSGVHEFRGSSLWQRRMKNAKKEAVKRIPPTSDDEKEMVRQFIQEFYRSAYNSLEWGLMEFLKQSVPSAAEQALRAMNAPKMQRFLTHRASALGLYTGRERKVSLNTNPNRLQNLDRGNADMGALLARGILGAYEDDNHPFRGLCRHVPELLVFVDQLKRYRDGAAHAGTVEDLEELEQIESCVSGLLKQLKIQNDGEASEEETAEDAHSMHPDRLSRMRRNASAMLEARVGVHLRPVISDACWQDLLRIEFKLLCWPEELKEAPEEVSEWIVTASRVLEGLFTQILKSHEDRVECPSSARIQDQAEAAAAEAGYEMPGGDLPESLQTVSRAMLNRTFDSGSGSLGAQCLCFLVSFSSEKLKQHALLFPETLQAIDRILCMRRHGNDLCFLSYTGLLDLQKSLCKLIKSLLES